MKWTQYIKKLARQTRGGKEINYNEVKSILKKDPSTLLLDVRSVQEYREGSLPGAKNIPSSEIKKQMGKGMLENKERTIVVFCSSGTRSNRVAKLLENNGYQEVYQLRGGLEAI